MLFCVFVYLYKRLLSVDLSSSPYGRGTDTAGREKRNFRADQRVASTWKTPPFLLLRDGKFLIVTVSCDTKIDAVSRASKYNLIRIV